MRTRRMSELLKTTTKQQPKLVMATAVTRRRISPRSLSKCQTERARKAKLISKSLFGISSRAELREHIKATENGDSAKTKWEFDFSQGKPMRLTKDFKWEAVPSDEVPKVYSVTHVKRLRSTNSNFEGQLPKLRYYHHIKKIEPVEENNNKIVSVKTQPITASAKKNEISGQMKITDFLKERKRLVSTRKKRY